MHRELTNSTCVVCRGNKNQNGVAVKFNIKRAKNPETNHNDNASLFNQLV